MFFKRVYTSSKNIVEMLKSRLQITIVKQKNIKHIIYQHIWERKKIFDYFIPLEMYKCFVLDEDTKVIVNMWSGKLWKLK